MLHLHFITALRDNPAMPFLAFLLFMLYLETVIGISGKEVKLLPRKTAVWITVIVVFCVFYVVRNIFPVLGPVS